MRFVAAVATFAWWLAGCSPAPLMVGTSPEILWWTDHEEEGGLDGWTRDGADRGGVIALNGGSIAAELRPARVIAC